jgi:hypothetical protein
MSSHLMRRAAVTGLLMIAVTAWPPLSGTSRARSQEQARLVWWLTATFEPRQTQHLSLRASEIDPGWVALSPLDAGALPADAAGDSWMKRDGFRFSWEGRLHKGRTTRIATGVYKAQDGSTGRFLLVLEKPARGSWQVKLLHKEDGEAGFSILRTTPVRNVLDAMHALRRVPPHRGEERFLQPLPGGHYRHGAVLTPGVRSRVVHRPAAQPRKRPASWLPRTPAGTGLPASPCSGRSGLVPLQPGHGAAPPALSGRVCAAPMTGVRTRPEEHSRPRQSVGLETRVQAAQEPCWRDVCRAWAPAGSTACRTLHASCRCEAGAGPGLKGRPAQQCAILLTAAGGVHGGEALKEGGQPGSTQDPAGVAS